MRALASARAWQNDAIAVAERARAHRHHALALAHARGDFNLLGTLHPGLDDTAACILAVDDEHDALAVLIEHFCDVDRFCNSTGLDHRRQYLARGVESSRTSERVRTRVGSPRRSGAWRLERQ